MTTDPHIVLPKGPLTHLCAVRRLADRNRFVLTGWTWIPIRSLAPRHRERIAAHLLALDAHARYLRFGYPATDTQIAKYVDTLDFDRDEVFGIFNRRLELVAMAHLAHPMASAPSDQPQMSEFGVSVVSSARRRGLRSAPLRARHSACAQPWHRRTLHPCIEREHGDAEDRQERWSHRPSRRFGDRSLARTAGRHLCIPPGRVRRHACRRTGLPGQGSLTHTCGGFSVWAIRSTRLREWMQMQANECKSSKERS